MTKTLEIDEQQAEECNAVAFHPSGFHLVCALNDKILLMNIFVDSLATFDQVTVKQCRELQFANGGHLYAAMCGNQVNIYNFWTGEMQQFKGHSNKIKSISWFEDDSGFVSSGLDGGIYQYSLRDNENREDEYTDKTTTFPMVVKVPDQKVKYAVSTSNQLLEIEQGKVKNKTDANCPLS